jgi:hypothetical protein
MKRNIRANIARSDDTDLSNRPTKHCKRHKNPPFLSSEGRLPKKDFYYFTSCIISRITSTYFFEKPRESPVNNPGADQSFVVSITASLSNKMQRSGNGDHG